MREINLVITDPIGLHAKPASICAAIANKFISNVSLIAEGKTFEMKSIISVMSSALPTNTKIKITTEGRDEDDAIVSIKETLVKYNIAKEL